MRALEKLRVILFALLMLAAPLLIKAQVESTAGSMKIGVHFDATYDYSPESLADPDPHQFAWEGNNSVTGQDLFVELTGKVGDRVSYKVLEGLVWETAAASFTGVPGTMQIETEPGGQRGSAGSLP